MSKAEPKGWVVMGKIKKKGGTDIIKQISRLYYSTSAAEVFRDIAKKEKLYDDVWITEKY